MTTPAGAWFCWGGGGGSGGHQCGRSLRPAAVTVPGDGFTPRAAGPRRWGRFGAAGVLVRCAGAGGGLDYFLARRSEWCHQGGSWAVPGGAPNDGENPLAGALREVAEEGGVELTADPGIAPHEDDHGRPAHPTAASDRPGP